MMSPEADQVDGPASDRRASARARTRTVATVGTVAVLLLALVILGGRAVAHSWTTGSSAGTAPVRATTAPPTAVDPSKIVGNICSASQADMEHWVTVARSRYPDAERFADFLGHEAYVIDQNCPDVRSTYDAATLAAANIRLGVGEDNPTAP